MSIPLPHQGDVLFSWNRKLTVLEGHLPTLQSLLQVQEDTNLHLPTLLRVEGHQVCPTS